MSRHKNETKGSIHIPFQWEYADTTAMNAATGFVDADLGKLCRINATPYSYYQLVELTPTWYPISPQAITGDVSISATGGATVTDLTIASEAQGDLLTRGASAWQRKAKGTANQIFGMNSGATDQEYKTLTAGSGISISHGAGSITITNTGGSSVTRVCITLDGIAYAATKQAGILLNFAGSLTGVKAYSDTAPTGASIQIDVNKNGTTMLTTICEIDASANADDGNVAIKSDGTEDFVSGDRITIDIDQVGSTVAGGNFLYITLELTPS